ncbi:MaoC family dehydratase N-terminal domain-containing protein [Actinomadura madurae]|uniref:FAS1-like dehydratase domain-containing protein n=1 Tax=Actinomadura madurae TaxID=1993 RepID=UPI00399B08AC
MSIGRFPIEAGQVLTFVQAIGDENPVYRVADAALEAGLGAVAAPPTFVQASAHYDPDYPLRPHPDAPWFGSASGSGVKDERRYGVLHAEQHFVYHRPLVVGDVLTADVTEGATWEKDGRRGGRLVFSETITVYRDTQGAPVVTARLVGVRTENQPETK